MESMLAAYWKREARAAITTGKKHMAEETITMKAIVVTDQAAGTAGMTLVERPEPQAAINDVIVLVNATGFVPTEMAWPRSDERRVGNECVRTCTSRWLPLQ